MSKEEAQFICNAGFNEWLASLPLDEWGDSYEEATPIYWDEALGTWVEGDLSC